MIKSPWLLLMGFLGILFLSLMVWSVDRSQTAGSRVLDTDYVVHGLNPASALHHTGPTAAGGLSVDVRRRDNAIDTLLLDEHGRGVSGAHGEIYLLGATTTPSCIVLQESGNGHYLAQLPTGTPIAMRLQLRMQYGTARFEQMLSLTP